MGKFGDTKKRKLVDDGDEDDPELDAEIAAVMAMHAEKEGRKLGKGKKARRDAEEEEEDDEEFEDYDEDDDDDDEEEGGEEGQQQQKQLLQRRGLVGKTASKTVYNREGLKDSVEGLATSSLPFVESMQVCEFEADIQDEHDDLQREVREVPSCFLCEMLMRQ